MTADLPPDAANVLTTWFGHEALDAPVDAARQKRWFVSDPAFDRELAERFGPLIEAAADGRLAAWEASARGALALVLLLDQFTRNVFRDQARAFEADPVARGVADRAIARGFDRTLPFFPRSFVYLPFEHAEALALQDRAVDLFRQLAADAPPALAESAAGLVGYAERHRAVIARFGRFPHRNVVLGRASTAEESAFLEGGRGF